MLLRRILENVFVVLLCFHLDKKRYLKITSSQESSVFLPIKLKLDPEVGFCFQWRFHQGLMSWLLRGIGGQWTEPQSCHQASCVLPSGFLTCTPFIPVSPPFLFQVHLIVILVETSGSSYLQASLFVFGSVPKVIVGALFRETTIKTTLSRPVWEIGNTIEKQGLCGGL